MVIQPCVCIAASHVGLAGLPVLAVYSSATFCIAATLFCFSFTDILSKISCLNFCGAKVQLFFDIRKYLEKNLLISLLFTVNPLCQRSIIQCFKCQDRTLYFHCILYYILFPFLWPRVKPESLSMHSRVIPEPLSRDNLLSPHFTCSFFYPAYSLFQLSHALETFTYILQPAPFFIACSFFALLVPFLPPKGTTLHSTLCIFLFFSLQACIFFIYLVSFFV